MVEVSEQIARMEITETNQASVTMDNAGSHHGTEKTGDVNKGCETKEKEIKENVDEIKDEKKDGGDRNGKKQRSTRNKKNEKNPSKAKVQIGKDKEDSEGMQKQLESESNNGSLEQVDALEKDDNSKNTKQLENKKKKRDQKSKLKSKTNTEDKTPEVPTTQIDKSKGEEVVSDDVIKNTVATTRKKQKGRKPKPQSKEENVGQSAQNSESQKEGGETVVKEKETQESNQKRKEKKSKSKSKKNIATENTRASSLTPAIPPNQPQTTNDLNYKKGEKIVVLHVAEKPSIAQSIAKGLCKGNYETLSKVTPIHQFSSPPFPKAPNASKCVHKVTSVAGHVYNVDFPSSYQSWDSVDPADLFHAPITKKPCKSSIVKHLSDSAKGVDFIVLWLDCDREGENIAFEVLDCCLGRMDGSSPYDRVYRAYFSAINPSDIQKAYDSLGKPDKNQSLAVDARQELDLKVGVAFSRFQTRYFQGRYGDLDSAVLSYGPCQTPTLGFCVKRHIDIETFKPEPYWLMDLGLYKRGRVFRAQSNAGRSFNQQKIQQWIKTVFDASPPSTAVVSSVVSKEKKQGRPVPLNTVSLLKACSKALGIGPHSAMQTAERLYLSGYLSYPRTESTAYPKSFDIRGALQIQASDSRWGSYVSDLLKTGNCKPKGGVDMGDHPPITPCKAAAPHELSGDMSRVYELVTRHFIASVSQDASWNNTKVSIDVDILGDKGNFTIRGKQLVSPGFLAVLLHKEYGDEKDESLEYSIEDETEEVENLPEFKVGEVFSLVDAKAASQSKVSTIPTGSYATLGVKEKMTVPPSHLSESELINLMEKNGIGTDASIATHIENICKRNYVELVTGRKLVPTKLGLVLAQGYHLIDNSLVLPKVRADIEKECNKVAKGLADKETVLKNAIEIFSTKFHNFVKDIGKMDILFSSSFAKLQDIGKPFTRCGFSRRYLTFITGPPPRLYNKFTETVYPLPVGGTVKEWSGRNCPVEGCNFELCTYSGKINCITQIIIRHTHWNSSSNTASNS
jgi:DNA topoisomerase-3